jgi:hypothetical protein
LALRGSAVPALLRGRPADRDLPPVNGLFNFGIRWGITVGKQAQKVSASAVVSGRRRPRGDLAVDRGELPPAGPRTITTPASRSGRRFPSLDAFVKDPSGRSSSPAAARLHPAGHRRHHPPAARVVVVPDGAGQTAPRLFRRRRPLVPAGMVDRAAVRRAAGGARVGWAGQTGCGFGEAGPAGGGAGTGGAVADRARAATQPPVRRALGLPRITRSTSLERPGSTARAFRGCGTTAVRRREHSGDQLVGSYESELWPAWDALLARGPRWWWTSAARRASSRSGWPAAAGGPGLRLDRPRRRRRCAARWPRRTASPGA